MTDNVICVKEFAESNGLLRQTVFKVLKRLGIEPTKSRGGSENRGQTISYITEHDARSVLEALTSSRNLQNGQDAEESELPEAALYDIGVFICCAWSQSTIPAASRLALPTTLTSACGICGVQRHIHKWSRHGHVGGFGRKPQ